MQPTGRPAKAQGGSKVRLAGETAYQARTWIHPRRAVYKAEALWANVFRVLMHAAAYWLLDTLRRWLLQAIGDAARMQLDTLRLRLVKFGARLHQLPGRLRFHLASSYPGRASLACPLPLTEKDHE